MPIFWGRFNHQVIEIEILIWPHLHKFDPFFKKKMKRRCLIKNIKKNSNFNWKIIYPFFVLSVEAKCHCLRSWWPMPRLCLWPYAKSWKVVWHQTHFVLYFYHSHKPIIWNLSTHSRFWSPKPLSDQNRPTLAENSTNNNGHQ